MHPSRRAGRLVAVGPDGYGVIELAPSSACARCARGRGCGAALFVPGGAPTRLRCTLAAPFRPGTAVELDVPDLGARWLLPVLLAYGPPTLGLVAGACVPEPWTPAAALIGLAGGLLAGRLAGAWLERSVGWASIGTSRAGSGPCVLLARTPRDDPDAVLAPAAAFVPLEENDRQ